MSAVSAVPAYAGVPLTDAKHSRAVHVVTAARRQGRLGAGRTGDDVTVVLLGDAGRGRRRSLTRLAAAGRDPTTPVAVTEHGHDDRAAHGHRDAAAAAPALPGDGRLATPLWPWSGSRPACASSCPGSRPSRCSAGGCWCRAPRSRPGSTDRPAAPLRRGQRGGADDLRRAAAHAAADGAGDQGHGRPAATSGSASPASTRSRPSARSSRSSGSTPARSPA